MTCLVPSSKASLKSQGQVLLGEVGRLDEGEELLLVLGMKGGLKVLTIFVREVKVIMATNKVVVLAGGQVEEMVVQMVNNINLGNNSYSGGRKDDKGMEEKERVV